jgi:hypothetical protein
VKCGRFAVLTTALFLSAAAAACAEPIETTAALSVNGLIGEHEVSRGHRERLSLAPLPLAEITFRRGAQSIRLEGLPPVTLGYFAKGGASSTSLSILNATLRQAFQGGWFVAVGQTVYNQNTTYGSRPGDYVVRGFDIIDINGAYSQYSRVTGIRLEVGRVAQAGVNRLEYAAAVNPRMHSITYTRIPTFFHDCPPGATSIAQCTQHIETFADGENAAQIDLIARVAHRVSKNGEILLGLRYLNYTAHYDDNPGQIADRNVGFAPAVGYRVKL